MRELESLVFQDYQRYVHNTRYKCEPRLENTAESAVKRNG